MLKSLTIKDVLSVLSFLGGALLAIYGLGARNAVKDLNTVKMEQKVDTLSITITSLKSEVATFRDIVDQHLKSSDMQRANFVTLERSYVDNLKLINRMDQVVRYYEEKQRYQDSVTRSVKYDIYYEKIK